MSTEKITDSSLWSRNYDGTHVQVEDSQPQGNTQFKRVVGLPNKAGKLIIRRITMKTDSFLKQFTKLAK